MITGEVLIYLVDLMVAILASCIVSYLIALFYFRVVEMRLVKILEHQIRLNSKLTKALHDERNQQIELNSKLTKAIHDERKKGNELEGKIEDIAKKSVPKGAIKC